MINPLIIDTGYANILSIKKAVEFLGYTPIISADPSVISKSQILILPGVGAFDHVMKHLRSSQIDLAIKQSIANSNNKILGICLGLQLLAEFSDEGNGEQGLGLIKGIAKKISANNEIKVPHIGFNSINMIAKSKLLNRIPPDHNFYFIHSFALNPESTPSTVATTTYGTDITSVIEHESRIFGTQFHPEKSQKFGLNIIDNFLAA